MTILRLLDGGPVLVGLLRIVPPAVILPACRVRRALRCFLQLQVLLAHQNFVRFNGKRRACDRFFKSQFSFALFDLCGKLGRSACLPTRVAS